jgi:PASTA domain
MKKRMQQPGWLGAVLAAASGFLLGVVLLVALGGVVHDHTKTVVDTVTHTRVHVHVHTTVETQTVTVKTDPNLVTVPDLVGDALDDAQQQLSDLDLAEDDNGGGVFGVIDPSNWQVVDTHPKPGAHVHRGSVVELDVEHD